MRRHGWSFCENLTSDSTVLSHAESHHLLHVLRAAAGDALTLFDGRGTTADAVISRLTRHEVTCEIICSRALGRSVRPRITAAVSPPKADRLKWLVEKLTELGVDQLVLLETERTVVSPGDSRVEKLRASVIAACKQCQRPWAMELGSMQPIQSFLKNYHDQPASGRLFLAHPGLCPTSLPELEAANAPHLTLLIGPEGGFTENEVAAALQADAVSLSWPETILRTETAALVFSTVLLSRFRAESTSSR